MNDTYINHLRNLFLEDKLPLDEFERKLDEHIVHEVPPSPKKRNPVPNHTLENECSRLMSLPNETR